MLLSNREKIIIDITKKKEIIIGNLPWNSHLRQKEILTGFVSWVIFRLFEYNDHLEAIDSDFHIYIINHLDVSIGSFTLHGNRNGKRGFQYIMRNYTHYLHVLSKGTALHKAVGCWGWLCSFSLFKQCAAVKQLKLRVVHTSWSSVIVC